MKKNKSKKKSQKRLLKPIGVSLACFLATGILTLLIGQGTITGKFIDVPITETNSIGSSGFATFLGFAFIILIFLAVHFFQKKK